MGPRREDDSTAASRLLNEANNTLNRFLGGSSSRRMSWLNGGTASINPHPRPPAHQTSPPSRTHNIQPDEAETRPSDNGSRNTESTSNSPQLPNNALAVPAQAVPSSISPPQTPNMHQSPEPFAITYIETITSAVSDMTTDDTRKRKQIDAFAQDGPLKRMSILGAGAAGSPPLPHTLGRSTSPREVIAPAKSPQMNGSMGVISPTSHSRQHSDLSSTWQQAHQAYADEMLAPRPQQQQRPPSHGQVPCTRDIPSNLNTTISSRTLYHSTNPIRRTSSIHSPLVGSPTTPNPAQQYPSPQSASVSTMPPQPQRGYPPSHQSPRVPAMPIPQQASKPSLPVIQPYSKENCVPAIRKFHLQLTLDGLPPLAGVEYSRTDMLFRAAEDNDSLFLFVHQVVTLAHIDLDVVPSILRKAPGFSSAVTQMQHMLAGDEIKNYKLLDFYTKLPCQLNFLAMEAPDSYQTLTKHMKHLSYSLSTDWPALKQVCLQRGYPPLATEMWVLNMFSPSLMDVFFTALMRQIWDFTKPNFIPGTHEHVRNLYEENKRALYGSSDGWIVQPAVIAEIGALSHHQFAMMLQQLAARRRQPRSGQNDVTHQGGVLRSNALSSHGAPSSPRVISPHTMQPPPVQPNRQLLTQMRSSSASRHSDTPLRPVQHTGGLLLPPAGAPRPNQAATATWTLSALHQAQLRDPRFDFAANIKQDDLLYQSVHAFAVSPRRLNGTDLYQTFSLTILPDARIAQTIDPQDGQRKLRRLSEDSLQFRLRIVKVGLPPPNPNIQENLEQDWVLKPTSWPTNFYYLLNDHELEVRRKQHHTKDLPIDITEFMRQGGEMNTLAIYGNVGADEAATLLPQYAFAIEVIGANSHKSILEQCEKRIISSEASLNTITASLKRPLQVDGADDDDDDLIIDDARTNITIYDPICQGKICALPARGEGCKHRECFDLLTFLQTRPREQPTWPSEADAWKCPICLGDVRPQRLVIDGFLKEVGEKLTSEGKEKTRVIIVEADGSWTPKIEEGLDSGRSTPEVDEVMVDNTNTSVAVVNGTPILPNAPQLAKKRMEIIILDDD